MENKILSLENELKKYKSKNINNSENIVTTLKKDEKILAVNFVSIGTQEIINYNLICKNTDLFISLEERL